MPVSVCVGQKNKEAHSYFDSIVYASHQKLTCVDQDWGGGVEVGGGVRRSRPPPRKKNLDPHMVEVVKYLHVIYIHLHHYFRNNSYVCQVK